MAIAVIWVMERIEAFVGCFTQSSGNVRLTDIHCCLKKELVTWRLMFG